MFRKIFAMVLFLVVLVFTFSNITGANSLDDYSRLPITGNNAQVQVGRFWQLSDGAVTTSEHLYENLFVTHTQWTATNDIAISGGGATWTWADAVQSKLSQGYDSMLVVCKNAEELRLTYDVAIGTVIKGGKVSAYVQGICDSTALDITVGTGKTVSITTNSTGSATDDFEIIIVADSDVNAGAFTLDNLYLTGYAQSPITLLTGYDIDLTTPVNAVELILDPGGVDVKLEIGDDYYTFNTKTVIPCAGDAVITIANDSGSTATINFSYNMVE